MSKVTKALLKILEQRVFKPPPPNSRYFWITLNFKPNTAVSDCIHLVKAIANKSYISSYYYVFEQRQRQQLETFSDFNDFGLHTHLLIKVPFKLKRYNMASKIRHDLSRSERFKKVMINNKNLFNIKTWSSSKYNYHIDKIDYIRGKKTGVGKAEKQILDLKLRNHFQMEDFYSNDLDYLCNK